MKLRTAKYIFSPVPIAVALTLVIQPLYSQNSFKKKLPDHLKLQYAGGTGFLSVGGGYSNKSKKLEADLYYGYLPRSIGGVRIHSLSAKLNWIPFHVSVKKKLRLEPLATGLVASYNFGKQYFAFDPPNYSYKYYSFPTAINAAIFIGGRIAPNKPKRLALYYELLTLDRDLLSFIDNPRSLHMSEIFTVAMGVQVNVQ